MGQRGTQHRSAWRGLTFQIVAVAGLATGLSLAEPRTIDGSGNNVDHPEWGMAGIRLIRATTPDYADLAAAPAGASRPSARFLSNAICAQPDPLPNSLGATDLVWQWGQFLDHDLDLTEGASPAEAFDIPVPTSDPFFDPTGTGTQVIPLSRSHYDPASGTMAGNPRQQMNAITAFIDASNVYGSDPVRAAALRSGGSDGLLATSHFGTDDPSTGEDDYLPRNTPGLPNAGGPDPNLFLAGDVRANEQVALTAMHTLFVREHNRLARAIAAADPELNGDEVYEAARAIVGAQMQVITYNEFLPVLLGAGALSPYQGYDPDVDPGIMNVFSTAVFRFGHSLLSPELLRLDADLDPIPAGDLPLREAFFAPHELDPATAGGIAPLLRGLATGFAQDLDVKVIDDVRNFLFGPPGSGGFDLPSLNMQRGRDHGLCSYNKARIDLGLAPALSFADITSDMQLQAELAAAYGDVDEIDPWVGGLAEERLPGAFVGELLSTVLKRQFEALRDGDRFWYQLVFDGPVLEELESTRLADVIRRNTEIDDEIGDWALGDPCLHWARPREARQLLLDHDATSAITFLSWTAPQELSGTEFALHYETIRSSTPTDFVNLAECLPAVDDTQTATTDPETPDPGSGFYYLVRATNSCPTPGTLGVDSSGGERVGIGCP